MNDGQNDMSVDKWIPIAGYVSGSVTLVFLMVLVFADIALCDQRGLVAVIAGFGFAMAFGFIGGSAAARGNLPVPFMSKQPIAFSVAGGAAVFVVSTLLVTSVFSDNDCAPSGPCRVNFQAGTSSAFIPQALFSGSICARRRTIEVDIQSARFEIVELPSGEEARRVYSILAALAGPDPSGGWQLLQASSPIEIDQQLRLGHVVEVERPLVIPPKIGVAQKWKILIMARQEIPHAKITIQRPPDSEYSQAGRGGDVGAGPLPRARHQQRDVLQVAGQVRRHGRLAHGSAQGA